ncbi:Rieske 2Fe-2S domain-containing protein [Streptomyces sioyaensis]|uniref:Rieske 2Fe-2S domain-containing protein n=1 Tax=Streptomyces sioyaensis TaxID=67364 RepID=UPI0036EF1628
MRITSIGHAGLFIESAAGSIVCDPWFTPAYFGSWVPFPDNTGVDPARLAAADYLYISHLHHDHYDPQWLSRYMRKDITVLLPDFPVPDLHHALAGLGFKNFVQTRHNQPLVLDSGLRVQISSVDAPLDGPLGDSGIALDDGRVRIFNQNDSRPIDLRPIQEFGPLHAHLVQYSGAIWFPGAYTFPERMKRTLGTRKRRNGMARALRYIEQLGAEHVLPFAGPACFLDDELWHLNDFDSDPANPFPDQFAFLDFLQEQGFDRAHLFLTGTEVDLHPDGTARVAQIPEEEVARIRDDRRGYLAEYQRKVQPAIDAITRALPQDRSDLVAQLKEYVEPLMKEADHTCAGINGRILLEVAAVDGGPDENIVFDFLDRRVDRYAGEEARYVFRVRRPLVEELVRGRCANWVDELFLSSRLEISRKGPYNDYVYTFFKSFSPEHMAFVEDYYAQADGDQHYALADGYVVPRRCPHLQADLTRFGSVKNGVLTCALHNWDFELATGRCLTSDDRTLDARPATPEDERAQHPVIPDARPE